MTTEHEELIAKARARVKSLGRADIETESEILLWVLAAALERTKPRTVATVEELDALPLATVILDEGAMPRHATSSIGSVTYWSEPGCEEDLSSAALIAHILGCEVEPVFTILWMPEDHTPIPEVPSD